MADGARVLVVDDEPQLLRALRINLKARGFDVTTAATGAAALAAAAKTNPQAVVLDLGLPDIDGFEVLAGLRGWTNVPVIVLSARGEAVDKVAALDAGADDYVTKPFGMEEFVARLRAAIRRGAGSSGEPTAENPMPTTATTSPPSDAHRRRRLRILAAAGTLLSAAVTWQSLQRSRSVSHRQV